MKTLFFIIFAVWTVTGFAVLATLIGYKAFEFGDMPAYGLDPDREGLLHTLTCLVLWPHAAWKGLKAKGGRDGT